MTKDSSFVVRISKRELEKFNKILKKKAINRSELFRIWIADYISKNEEKVEMKKVKMTIEEIFERNLVCVHSNNGKEISKWELQDVMDCMYSPGKDLEEFVAELGYTPQELAEWFYKGL